MSDLNNPWQSPETQVTAGDNPRGLITEGMLRYLREASPWLRFVGIVSFIGGGLLCLAGIGLSIAAAAGSGVQDLGNAFSEILGGFVGVVYLVSGVVVLFPAKFMYSFGSRIRQYAASGAAADLEEALKNNKSLWKFSGILCIVYLSFIPLVIIGAIIVAVI
jgi:hypothetical protein